MEEKSNEFNNRKSVIGLSAQVLTQNELVAFIVKCANFAAIKHSKQRRCNKEQTPYINHPIGVANILVEEGNVYDPNVIVAALLHDTVEDTDTSFEEIEEHFGEKVRKIVEEVTDDKSLPKLERKRLQIVHAPDSSFKAKLVKLADKLYNLRDLEKETPVGWSLDRVDQYFEWAKSVVNGLKGTNAKLEKLLDAMFDNHDLKIKEIKEGLGNKL
ncbi:guanosine-3',5'-bis(diphosphate) 3'-pyrophosphohydrolase MESH1 [Copidosoma floridanum]|uniref:guanosine-3',5'-bis(diphosphate) 3'-pyrophosphohydrolase MESH1 n=1 Tax=Copidosoma floridanum TaxID=29053 RepID=UPI0006C94122|nr:guanosine-3',5'-bis(diphosphate) 3'-pyrophosphohydrolase MESH1 [Copidosoma floridanum]